MVNKKKSKENFNREQEVGGQIVHPNPLEIYWEKYKKILVGFAVVIFLYVIGDYSFRFYKRINRNQTWSKITKAFLLRRTFLPPNKPTFESFGFPYKFALGRKPLIEPEVIGAEFSSTSFLWASLFSSQAFSFLGNTEKVEKSLKGIQGAQQPVFFMGDHILWPELLNGSQIEKEKKTPKKPKVVELDALQNISKFGKRNLLFRGKYPRLFSLPPVAKSVSVLLSTSLGDIRVRFFKKEASLYVANFLKNVQEGFYTGLRFSKIQHSPSVDPRFGFSLPSSGNLAWLGNPSSKNENRSSWISDPQPRKELPFVDSGISHFPFVVAAARVPGKLKISSDMVYFTASDCSKERDGEDVVFGVVVEGRSIIETIVNAELSSLSEKKSGVGVPKKPIKVVQARVEKD